MAVLIYMNWKILTICMPGNFPNENIQQSIDAMMSGEVGGQVVKFIKPWEMQKPISPEAQSKPCVQHDNK